MRDQKKRLRMIVWKKDILSSDLRESGKDFCAFVNK